MLLDIEMPIRVPAANWENVGKHRTQRIGKKLCYERDDVDCCWLATPVPHYLSARYTQGDINPICQTQQNFAHGSPPGYRKEKN